MYRPALVVMGVIVSVCLCQGFLSRVQDALVSGRALASYGRHLGLERYMTANGISMLTNTGCSSHTPSNVSRCTLHSNLIAQSRGGMPVWRPHPCLRCL